jgi:tetratricopeptide (TPR) repeat protein
MKIYDEAIAENRRWGELNGNKIKTDVSLAEIYAVSGRKEDSKKLIDKIEGKKLSANDYRGMAQVHVALGENDTAFMWLEKSYQHHEESLCSLKIDPKMSPLRNDPRFNSMLRKIGLEK